MKTIFIYYDHPKFFVMDGDLSHLDNISIDCLGLEKNFNRQKEFINIFFEKNTNLQQGLFDIWFHGEDYKMKVPLSEDFPHDLYINEIILGNTPKVVRACVMLE
jgi:hypothetical protein